MPIALSVSPVFDAAGRSPGRLASPRSSPRRAWRRRRWPRSSSASGEWEALAHVGRWLWDVGTDAVQWSDELHRMHGVDPLDFEGTLAAHLSVVHPDDRERVSVR